MGKPILRDGGNPAIARSRACHPKGIGLRFPSRDVAADGDVRKSGDAGGGLGKSYLFCLTATPTLESVQPEVGSSAGRARHRAVSGAPPAALENPEDRIPSTPVVLITASGLQGLGSGSGPERRLLAECSSCSPAGESGRRVPAGGRTGNGPLGGLPRASNNRLRTATGASARARPTHVRAFAPQGPVPLAQPARPTRRGGPPRSSLPNGRRAESFADDLKTDGGIVSSAEPRTPSRPSRGGRPPYRAQLRLALLAAWPAVVRAVTQHDRYGWLPPARRPGRVAAPWDGPLLDAFSVSPALGGPSVAVLASRPAAPSAEGCFGCPTVAATLAHELSWTLTAWRTPAAVRADSRRPCPSLVRHPVPAALRSACVLLPVPREAVLDTRLPFVELTPRGAARRLDERPRRLPRAAVGPMAGGTEDTSLALLVSDVAHAEGRRRVGVNARQESVRPDNERNVQPLHERPSAAEAGARPVCEDVLPG
uniref:Uncharacterized protein n=1 Tax=Zea mays TaxID=4577 RepID=A0A804UN63_MAIZE